MSSNIYRKPLGELVKWPGLKHPQYIGSTPACPVPDQSQPLGGVQLNASKAEGRCSYEDCGLPIVQAHPFGLAPLSFAHSRTPSSLTTRHAVTPPAREGRKKEIVVLIFKYLEAPGTPEAPVRWRGLSGSSLPLLRTESRHRGSPRAGRSNSDISPGHLHEPFGKGFGTHSDVKGRTDARPSLLPVQR